jgi:hypothetical protein
MGGKGGVITITRDGQHSQIWCDKGEIIDAESGPLRGEAAIYRILNFERGQVLADFHSEPRERTIELPGSMLLLEAARRKDESVRLLEGLGDHGTIYRSGAAPAPSAGRAERELLGLCDGARTLRDVLERSSLGELETLTALSSLVERGEVVKYGLSLAPQSATESTAITRDTPQHGVSFLPLVASQHVEPPRRQRSPIAFMAAGMGVGTVIWLLASTFPRAAAPPAGSSSAAAASAAERLPPPPFQVDSSVEPSHAELWLDGERVGVARVQRALPRDGRAHSLRVSAEGYAPTTLLFVDAPPPAQIVLEKLDTPAPPSQPAAAPGDVPSERTPSTESPAGAQRESLPNAAIRPGARRANGAARAKRGAPATARTPSERSAAPVDPAEPADESSRATVPRVQIIEDDVPVIQVIE